MKTFLLGTLCGLCATLVGILALVWYHTSPRRRTQRSQQHYGPSSSYLHTMAGLENIYQVAADSWDIYYPPLYGGGGRG